MNRLPRINFAAGFVLFLLVLAIFADFLSPNSPSKQNLGQFYHPPSKLHWLRSHVSYIPGPYISRTKLIDPLETRYEEDFDGASPLVPLRFFYRGYTYKFLGLIPTDRHLVGRNEEPFFYPVGTDELGRDVLARVLAGTRTSMLVVVLGLVFYSALGLTVGSFAGFCGGWIDSLLMRFSEFVLALPALYLVLALQALLPAQVPFFHALFLMVATIAAVAWPPMARGIRGLILQLRNSGYVEAAHSLGAGPFHIFRRHMLPSLIPFVLSQLTVAAPIFLLGEVILSFLNVGFRNSGESWGSMLRNLKDTRVLTDFWWNLLPLCMVFLTLLCFNLMSNGSGKDKRENQAMRI